jgi:hypothetical protein
MSEDPLGFGAGDSNLYRYAGNSPTNHTDPSGQIVPLIAIGIGLYLAGGSGMYWYAGEMDEAAGGNGWVGVPVQGTEHHLNEVGAPPLGELTIDDMTNETNQVYAPE